MKLKSTVAAALLAACSVGAFATTVSFNDELATFFGSVKAGSFTKSFTFDNLADSTYNIDLALYTTNISSLTGTLDSHPLLFVLDTASPIRYKSELVYTGSKPVTLTFSGLVAAKKVGTFQGKVTAVSAVPEPETYAMLLAGLGLVGTIARRRAQKQAA